jgi:hypothetical protein
LQVGQPGDWAVIVLRFELAVGRSPPNSLRWDLLNLDDHATLINGLWKREVWFVLWHELRSPDTIHVPRNLVTELQFETRVSNE